MAADAGAAAAAAPIDSEEPEETPGYKVAEFVATKELLEKDKDDESLNKWKAELLKGAAAAGASDDPRNVVIMFLSLESGDHVLKFPLDTKEAVEKMSATPLVVKEGVEYMLRIGFRVQKEIVMGLKYFHVVKKGPIPLEKKSEMLGSFAPNAELYEKKFAPDTAPSGMMARGSYNVTSKFFDDDKNIYLEFKWQLTIAKEWA